MILRSDDPAWTNPQARRPVTPHVPQSGAQVFYSVAAPGQICVVERATWFSQAVVLTTGIDVPQ
jgi:hypothetical protein